MMNTNTYLCGSCAGAGISDLGSHTDALDAMLNFCNQELGLGKCLLAPFYVFIAGPEKSGSGHSKRWVKYGTEFAAYIAENNLGVVVSPGAKLNLKYHADTTCQTWVWSPDQKAMEAWYQEHKVKKDGFLKDAPKTGVKKNG